MDLEMDYSHYIMEGEEEAIRLDLKTDPDTIKRQALWAGLQPGMRVADMGCGPGKTSFHLNELVKPDGSVIGIDISNQRITHALSHYQNQGVEYLLGDMRNSMSHLGEFDFIWVRFVLEHYRTTSFDIVRNIAKVLKNKGILCLIDLDHNCLSHYGISPKLNNAILCIMANLEKNANFDPYCGRKLYSYLYDLGTKRYKLTYPCTIFFGVSFLTPMPTTGEEKWKLPQKSQVIRSMNLRVDLTGSAANSIVFFQILGGSHIPP